MGGIRKPFTFQEQIRLAEELVAAHQRVTSIVVTNSNAPSIIELYESKGFKLSPFTLYDLSPAKATVVSLFLTSWEFEFDGYRLRDHIIWPLNRRLYFIKPLHLPLILLKPLGN